MLAIRMQRTGRKGHAHFRVVVQDSRVTPTSGRVVALVGNYDPHTKAANIDSEKAAYYLSNGAQPSDRVVLLFKKEGIKLPGWVKNVRTKESVTKNAQKLRRNQPAKETEPTVAEEPVAEVEPTVTEVPAFEEASTASEEPATEAAADEPLEAETPKEAAEAELIVEASPVVKKEDDSASDDKPEAAPVKELTAKKSPKKQK